jgi:dTDP-4-amino-4,6-dideoxygalactose transaminase
MKKMIKLFDPSIGREEEKILSKTLKSHFWAHGSGVGKVSEFESKFNKYIGSDECVAVSNGTAALHLALSLIDIKGKEVILPSLSFVSTAHAVLYNGGIPVFADIHPDTLCLDPNTIKKSITKKTRAVLPVHFAGMPSNLSEIAEICGKRRITLIEDAAHAIGTTFADKKIGSHGTAVCFSFHPVKNLAMPTGGAVTLNGPRSREFKNILNSKRWCGITNRKGPKYDVKDLGWNYYMNEFSAAIGIVQLKKIESMNNIRKKIAKIYSSEIRLQEKMKFSKDCAYHIYWVLVDNREQFMKNMHDNGIETGIHYNPIHKMHMYRGRYGLPITEKVGKNIVSIPIHPNLSDADIDKIVTSVNRFVK